MTRHSIPVIVAAAAALTSVICAQSEVWTYGHGRAGTIGDLPAITSAGGLPDIGNQAFAVGMVRGVGASCAVLVTGFASTETQLPFGLLLVDALPPAFAVTQLALLNGVAGQAGAGSQSLPLPLPASPGLLDIELYNQWFSFDVGVSSHLVHTDALGMRLGNAAVFQQCGSALTYGDHVVCSVTTGTFQLFTFQAAAGDVLFLRAVASGFQPRVQVYGPNGAPLHDVDPGCNDRNEITATLPLAGSHTVVVRDGGCSGPNQSGSFGVYLQRGNHAVAPAITIGSSATGRLEARGHAAAHTFDAEAGNRFMLRATASGHQPRIVLFDPVGGQTTIDAGCNELVERRAIGTAITGTYSLLITDDACSGSSQVGTWSLFLQRVGDPGSALAFPVGQTLSSGITTLGAAATYTTALSVGEVLFVRLVSAGHQPEVTVFDSAGIELGNASAGCSDEVELTCAPTTVAGTYTVVVRDATCSGSRQIGSHGIYLQNLAQPVAFSAIALNTTQAVTVDRRGTVVPVRITVVNNGTTLVLTLTAASIQPAFSLCDPAGNLLGSADPGCNVQSTRTFSGLAPGDYLLQIQDGGCSGSGQQGQVMVSVLAF